MKLSDLDPCLWQPPNQTYNQQPSTSTTALLNYDYQSGGGGEPSENYTELKPLPSSVFEYTTNLNQYDVSTTTSNIKTELVEYLLTSDIDDIAALIGSAIAETQQVQPGPEPVSSSTSNVDPWTELDQWIENACQLNSTGVGGSDNNGETTTADYILPSIVNDYNFNNTASPILQARLQSSSTLSTITTPQQQQNQLPESTSNTSNYGLLKIEPNYNVLIESNTSPTVSSTSVLINQRFNSNNSNHHLNNTNNKKINNGSLNSSKFSEQKQKKNRNNNNINKNKSSLSTIELTSDKEKPIHRCSICNRGFLNKSNIKVHLRTHTGEKPFKCEVCGKAFRQKAHLLKHVQIHKRITRD